MNPFVDGVVIVLFVLFMVFILGGYHRTKAAKRDADEKKAKEVNSESFSESNEDT